jgi:hypothetical protein
MTLPTVHLNGTAATDLREQYVRARRAVELAKHELGQAYPNGRDYYPQPGDAIKTAMDEHWSRMRRLNEVAEELMTLAEHVDKFCKD